ncbi:MAG: helix-turn-helix transcriptional regulator [Firmicutes bacterium]|nr:helix-turn-helix transcriptional regulator [Bacillota bacterium]
MIISERIFKLLDEKQISQKDFSEATGIAQSTISDWKRKKTNPASDKIMTICDVLEVSPYELLSGAANKYEDDLDYVIMPKDCEDCQFLAKYQSLKPRAKERLLGYLDALLDK